jgi:predicted Zn-dependent protease
MSPRPPARRAIVRIVPVALRLAGWIAGAIAVPVTLAVAAGHLGLVTGLALDVAAIVAVWLWLPRAAHAAFVAGKHGRATRRYAVLSATAITDRRMRAAALSRAACAIVLGRGGELALDPATLDDTERTVWLNNRACALLAADGPAAEALALADEAAGLRPDVPAVQHTRGLALLALGRLDDAIAVLDGMRAGGELPPYLEALRCRELARAWTRKGELAYAEDYTTRAAQLERLTA